MEPQVTQEQPANEPKTRRRLHVPLVILAVTALSAALPFAIAALRQLQERASVVKNPYDYPTAQLSALDGVVQARFAVVPENMFGLDRIGPMHELFAPITRDEKAAVAGLKKSGQDVAFYVVSRRTLFNERGPLGFYPVQGPIFITAKPGARLPRKKPIEDHMPGALPTPRPMATYEEALPNGTLVHPTPLARQLVASGLPRGDELVGLAAELLAATKNEDPHARLGARIRSGVWRIDAVPIRATNQACVDCHNGWNWSRDNGIEVKLGDPVGFAVYVTRNVSTGKSAMS